MLDDSFLYQKDFEEHYEKFRNQELGWFYKNVYAHGRLTEPEGTDLQNSGELSGSYGYALRLIKELTRENHKLQRRVHRLGLKNRAKRSLSKCIPSSLKKLFKYMPGRVKKLLEIFLYVPPKIKEYVVPAEVEGAEDTLELYKSLSDESFEDGLRSIQEQIISPPIDNPPLVSIIILTRDGLGHLQRLFENFDKLTGYQNYELIVVDNASKDGTKAYLNKLKKHINLRVVYNPENKSFSESNNIGARRANGKYLLFLNNDVSPTDGWLNHMMNTAIKSKDIGAVGAKLVYPYKLEFKNSYKIQHGGIGFRLEDDFIRPVNQGMGASFFSRNTSKEEEKAGVTAACLLVEKAKFDKVGGFDEAYWYGYEDVDLNLKLKTKGYRNIINNAAVLFHHEFGTQNQNKRQVIANYRRRNMDIFKSKWQKEIYPKLWQSLLGADGIYADKKLHFCFAVTEYGSDAAAGDYYTAKELACALEDKGYKVSFISENNSPEPYILDSDIDILISMIDGYDMGRIKDNRVIKIAWCRNWFERWISHDYFRDFDIVLANSAKARAYFKKELLVDSHFFEIATNRSRFTSQYTNEELAGYESDICFTGNYWHVPRDVAELLDVDKLKDRYQIKIFGKDWDEVKKLKPFWQGFLAYKNLPKAYAAGKILIDDATNIVNEWGSVNSRVFDGAASGILVLTNGAEGSLGTFKGLVPTFSSKEELTELLEKYLGDEPLRRKKANEIKEYVLANHTYEHRADELLDILKKKLVRKTINLKLPIPRWSEAKHWGDWHFGKALGRELNKQGFNVEYQLLPDWQKPNFAFANIVLRGLSVFQPPEHQLNIIWNISHPAPAKECGEYDYIFVASKRYSDILKRQGVKNVHTLYQCFDEHSFNAENITDDKRYKSDILFVGNTRLKFRPIVRDVLSWGKIDKYKVQIFGQGWNKFIDKKYIGGEYIENDELHNHYGNTKILLNDHWEDMNKAGFASNRLFDASACGAFIVSDANPGIKDIFGPGVIAEYNDPSSLYKLLDKYLGDPAARQVRAKKTQALVFKNHTFAHRAKQLLKAVKEL